VFRSELDTLTTLYCKISCTPRVQSDLDPVRNIITRHNACDEAICSWRYPPTRWTHCDYMCTVSVTHDHTSLVRPNSSI